MDGLVSQVGTQLLALGLPGIIILALAYIAWDRDRKLETSRDRYMDLAILQTKTTADNTSALERLTDLLKDRKA
jgi:hypothetical protein